MLLAIDIGNTNIAIGLYETNRYKKDKLLQNWRIATDIHKTADEYSSLLENFFARAGLNKKKIKFCLLASVVPPLEQVFSYMFTNISKIPYHYLSLDDIPVTDNLYNRYELGVDRMVNAYAGFQIYKKSLIVIDFGTAVTFDVVGSAGEYLGGVIMPSIHLAYDALNSKTAKLPKINFAVPDKIIGKNTTESMQSGMFFGYIGMIDSCIDKIADELANKYTGKPTGKPTGNEPIGESIGEQGLNSLVIATGGDTELLHNYSTKINKVEKELTLFGIYLLYKNIFT